MAADMVQQKRNNNKCYVSTFRYIYIYIYIDLVLNKNNNKDLLLN